MKNSEGIKDLLKRYIDADLAIRGKDIVDLSRLTTGEQILGRCHELSKYAVEVDDVDIKSVHERILKEGDTHDLYRMIMFAPEYNKLELLERAKELSEQGHDEDGWYTELARLSPQGNYYKERTSLKIN